METAHFIPPRERRKVLAASQQDGIPVIIRGEDGTGKGAISKWIHKNGQRSARPLIEWRPPMALAESLLEARGGAVVISRPEDLSIRDDLALRKLLQSKMVVDPNTQLPTLVQTRLFILAQPHQTLVSLQEVNRIEIDMPSLRERTDEFEDIAITLLTEFTRELHKEHIRGFHHLALTKLKEYDWPGNLRELRNVICLAVIHAKSNQIEATDLPHFSAERQELRANRGEFEKIYFEELMRVYSGRIDQISAATRTSKERLLLKVREYGLTQMVSGLIANNEAKAGDSTA